MFCTCSQLLYSVCVCVPNLYTAYEIYIRNWRLWKSAHIVLYTTIIGTGLSDPYIDNTNVRNFTFFLLWHVRHPRAAVYGVHQCTIHSSGCMSKLCNFWHLLYATCSCTGDSLPVYNAMLKLLPRENEGSKGDKNKREFVVNPNQPNKERSG